MTFRGRFILAALVLGLASPSQAQAALTVDSSAIEPVANAKVAKLQVTEAGRHPDLRVAFATPKNGMSEIDRPESIALRLPPGLVGNPLAVLRCPYLLYSLHACPEASKVGTLTGHAELPGGDLYPTDLQGTVYNVDPAGSPHPTVPGLLGFDIDPIVLDVLPKPLSDRVLIPAPVKLGPSTGYQLATTVSLPKTVFSPVLNMEVGFELRQMDLRLFGWRDATPFLTNPTRCAAASGVMTLRSAGGEVVKREHGLSYDSCDKVPAPDAGVAVTPGITRAATPTSFAVGVTSAQPVGAVQRGLLRRAEVTMPEGVALSPGVVEGLELCTPSDFAAADDEVAQCPAGSRIGTASLKTPLLGDALTGSVFLGQRLPDTALGYQLLIDVRSTAPAVAVKVVGRAVVAEDGTIRAIFDDLPQVPFTDFDLSFDGPPHAMLRTPERCGVTAVTKAGYRSWASAATVAAQDDFVVEWEPDEKGCPPSFPDEQHLSASLDTEQAGASPNLLTVGLERGDRQPALRDLRLRLPAGLNARLAQITSRCAPTDAAAGTCPAATRLGGVTIAVGSDPATETLSLSTGPQSGVYVTDPIHAGDPAGVSIEIPVRPNDAVDLGTVILPGRIVTRIGDAGLSGFDIVTEDLPSSLLGVPLRIRAMEIRVDVPDFLLNPTHCGARALTATLADASGRVRDLSDPSPFSITGCSEVPFAAAAEVVLDPPVIATPASARIQIGVPGNDSGSWLNGAPNIRPADIAEADVLLPTGLTLNTGVAANLDVCDAESFDLASAVAAACPARSIIGSARLATVLLDAPLLGPVYLGRPKADAESGELRYPLLIEATGAGIRIKLRGEAMLDTGTGQIRTRFTDLPEVPLTTLSLTLNGGASGLVRAPRSCGTAVGEVKLTPASAGPAAAVPVTVDTVGGEAGCGSQFAPTLGAEAGLVAGRPSSLTLRVTRADRDLPLERLGIDLPAGLMGSLTAVPACDAHRAAAGDCAEASRVGVVRVTVGPDTAPVTIDGPMYLTAPNRAGQAAGLVIPLLAKAGPITLGRVVLRAGITVRSRDAGLTVETDPIPTMIAGVPLSVREVAMEISRPGFLVAPTNCAPKRVSATFGSGDRVTRGEAQIQAIGCEALTSRVDVTATVGARGRTKAASRPPLTVDLRPRLGGAAMRQMSVLMPAGLAVDLKSLSGICSVAQAAANNCPAAAVVGRASATTPVLADELSGDVVMVQEVGNVIPALMVRLRDASGAVDLQLRGVVELPGGRMRATFDGLPDVPLSRFTLALKQDGVLTTASDLCAATARARLETRATFHNAAVQTGSHTVFVSGCAVARAAGAPTITARLSRAASRKPVLTLSARGAGLRTIRVALPRGLTTTAAATRGVVRRPRGLKVTRTTRSVRGRSTSPVRELRLSITRGLRVTAALRTRRPTLAVLVDGKAHKVVLQISGK